MVVHAVLGIVEVGGIPAHPLLVHGAVVLIALLGIATLALMVARANVRLKFALPLAAVSLALLVYAQLTIVTGEQLADATGDDDEPLVEEHEEQAELLRVVLAGMTVLLAATGFVERRERAAVVAAGDSVTDRRSLLAGGLRVLTGLGALWVVGATIVTGHSGATSVWQETANEIRAGGGGEGDDEGDRADGPPSSDEGTATSDPES